LAWFSVDSWLILINYYVTWVMVIHPLVVNSFNKVCPGLSAKQSWIMRRYVAPAFFNLTDMVV
jgi:hypothetical protein